MNYDRKQMLNAITAISWREMQDFSRQVASLYENFREGVPHITAMAEALVSVASDELAQEAERERVAKAAKQASAQT
jgi:hypothetical protein